jgi:hypothetical protein
MLEDKISQIETRIQNSAALKPETRAELLNLLAELKSETQALSVTHRHEAESIAALTEISTLEATRETKDPQLLEDSIGGLESSVDEFEKTHPQLVTVVNRIAAMLSNMGI